MASPVLAATAWQPTHTVEIVVSTSPGSGSDRAARLIQKLLTDKGLVRAPVVVVNKPGGQGVIGLTYLSQHSADGHYVMVTSPSLLANQITGRSKLGYRDTMPLAQLGAEYDPRTHGGAIQDDGGEPRGARPRQIKGARLWARLEFRQIGSDAV